MVELLGKLPEYASMLLELLGGLVIFASVVVRLTPTKSDDELLAKGEGYLDKLLSWMPTLGVNPKTKKMKELLDKIEGKK